MSTIYLLALAGVGLAILMATAEAVRSVSRKPQWSRSVFAKPSLQAVETIDRRQAQLPFVGKDRRKSAVSEAEAAAASRRAA